jgi:hypothetical protein
MANTSPEAVRKKQGRPFGSTNRRQPELLAAAKRLGADPIDFMLQIVSAVAVEVAQTDDAGNVLMDANGKPLRRMAPIDMATKIDCAKALAPYMYPRLSATQVTGSNNGPLKVAVDMRAILMNPTLAEAAQTLALSMAEAEAEKLGPYKLDNRLISPASYPDPEESSNEE